MGVTHATGKRNAVKANTLQDTRIDEPIMKPYVEIDFTEERACR